MKIKSAQEWKLELNRLYKQDGGRWTFADIEDIARIQSEALRYSAALCDLGSCTRNHLNELADRLEKETK